jgi:transcription antitermination factor NusG
MKELVAAPFPSDQWVRITDGPFREFTGKLEGEDGPERNLTVVVSFFGRPVRVKVTRAQFKKV